MKYFRVLLVAALFLICPQGGFGQGIEQPDWGNVSPIFSKRCINCHSEHGAAKGLRLDSYIAALAGSKNGPVLIPRDSENSELVRRIRGESTPRMPFLSKSLTHIEIDIIIRWVEAGLPNNGFE